MTTPYDLLLAELRRDRSRPLITYYDDGTGERVELSVATFDNWVAKTAGLLRDGLGVQPGSRLLVPTEDLGTGLRDGLLVPLTVGGSSVLVRHENAAGRQARIAAERVTAVAG